MQTYMTEASLAGELLEGEELLWSGRPDAQSRGIVSPTRVFLILGIIFLPLGLLAVIIGLILLLSGAVPVESQAGLLGIFIPGGVFSLLGLVYLIVGLTVRTPLRNTLYAITNRRVIILRTGRYLRVFSYGKRAIAQVQRIERSDGSGDIILSGSPSMYANQNGNGYYSAGRQGILSAIPNVRQVEQKVLSLLDES